MCRTYGRRRNLSASQALSDGGSPCKGRPPLVARCSSSQLSEEERGPLSYCSSEEELESPMSSRSLFKDGTGIMAPSLRHPVRACAIALLVVFSVGSWMPVLNHFLNVDSAVDRGIASDRKYEMQWDEGMQWELRGRARVFSEPGCEGESLVLTVSADLCSLHYPSNAVVKDNVASVLLTSDEPPGIEVLLYGTCAKEERPRNPMLLEILREDGCVDLKYPICGRVELRVSLPSTE
ncbi:MAG: hypothetical protein SGPRY_012098 [Prymnesium sp.]